MTKKFPSVSKCWRVLACLLLVVAITVCACGGASKGDEVKEPTEVAVVFSRSGNVLHQFDGKVVPPKDRIALCIPMKAGEAVMASFYTEGLIPVDFSIITSKGGGPKDATWGAVIPLITHGDETYVLEFSNTSDKPIKLHFPVKPYSKGRVNVNPSPAK
jgi:hypothetical protein